MKQIIYQRAIDLTYEIAELKTKIAKQEAALKQKTAEMNGVSREICEDLTKQSVDTVTMFNHKITFFKDVTCTILDSNRKDAMIYDRKFQIGLFRLVLNGMILKKWVKDMLQKSVTVPPFVTYEEQAKITVTKLD